MTPPAALHRLPAPLEAAIQRLKLAARHAAERSVDALGVAALSAPQTLQRDQLLEAQFELHRKLAAFALAFDEAYDRRVRRDFAPRDAEAAPSTARWDQLALVEDRELEQQVAAERFGLEIGHACESELRELAGYVGTLLARVGHEDTDRHPLRPEIIGHAMLCGIDAVSERREIGLVLQPEMARAMAAVMPETYTAILSALRAAGVQPAALTRRSRGPDTARAPLAAGGDPGQPSGGPAAGAYGGAVGSESGGAPARTGRAPHGGSGWGGAEPAGTPMGAVDVRLMGLMRRLALAGGAGSGGGGGLAEGLGGGDGAGYGGGAPANLIHAHRDELRRAAGGALDHVVIDVVGSLFDAILADPKVPPQMARLIARLQLPVLRAALGDPSFFSSRRHPVRRFVNRIASLGAAFDDFGDSDAQRFLTLVRELVEDIVDGDFDHIEPYEQKLALLEQFVADQARHEAMAHGDPAAVLAGKEEDLRLHGLYVQRLQREIADLAAPDFVRQFIAEVWSRVLLAAARQDGAQGERLTRMRQAGRELFMSVQPKAAPAQRKAFIAQLPMLMKDIGAGLDLIGWPEDARKAFYGILLPAHADSLKGQGLRTLEYNLLARQIESVLERPLPTAAELPPDDSPSTAAAVAAAPAAAFSPAEAARVGLLDEAAVDWNAPLDIDLDAGPELQPAELHIDGLPLGRVDEGATALPEPTRGASLADHVQLGFAYRMHLDGEWQKVRLTHISPARSFFVFTRGKRHQQAISLTRRMLVKMCESGRLRAFEAAYLMERATARARRQLATMSSPSGR